MWRPGQLENPPLILLADGLKIPCPNESFDIVILSDVLEHIEDPRLAIREVGRVLKLNGLAFFSFTPFYGPRGGHLWNYIPIPYVHFVLPYKVTRKGCCANMSH
jgi:ubiquinone/menaquinone biosynthesis C-methylase UbiE